MPLLLTGAGRAAPGGFTPATLPGYFSATNIASMRSAGKLWQDSGKTVPAVAAADPVRVIVDRSVEYTAPSDAARAVLGNSGVTWWLDFDGVDDYYVYSGPASIPLSVHAAFRWEGASGGTGAGFSAPANGQKFKMFDGGGGATYRGGKEGVSNWSNAASLVTPNRDYVNGLNYAATGDARYYFNGADDGLAQATVEGTGLAASQTRIGASSAGTELWNGRMYGWAIYTQAQSAANILLLHAYLARLMGVTFLPISMVPAAWYDASRSSAADAAAISSFYDYSGNARHAVQASGTLQPQIKVAIQNGLRIARFDGVDDYLKVVFTLPRPVTTFTVAMLRTSPADNAAFLDGGSFQTMAHFAPTVGSPLRMYAGATLSIGTTDTTAFHRYCSVWNSASSSGQIDDVAAVTGDAGSGTPGGVTLGMGGSGTNWPGAYDIGEVIVVPRVCTASEILSTLAYLKAKWGL